MAVASSSDYAKGSLLDSDQDWYHGQLTRAEAEQALRPSGKDCFLIRESKGALVLSLLNNQRSCHIKIKYGPGWYKLDLDSVTNRFAEVNDLLSYYRSHFVSDNLKVMLGEVCKKDSFKPEVDFDLLPSTSSAYAKACPSVSGKVWYHGELTRVEAEQALAASGNDCFLIRECEKSLVLSLIHHTQVHHINIQYGPGWYKLESGLEPSFTELDTLVSYYRDNTVSEFTLGVACEIKHSKDKQSADSSPLYDTTTLKASLPQQIPHNSYLYSKGEPEDSLPDHNIYFKGEPEDLSKHVWYHGNVTKEQAIQELLPMKMDAFLVHQDYSNLILSRKIAQVFSHRKIYRSPEGYRLEGKQRQFFTIPEMIAHYKQFPIDDKMLGAECERLLIFPDLDTDYQYDTISVDPAKYKWYHENTTEDQAHVILREQGPRDYSNCFLVRHSGNDLILSSKLIGYIHHDVINKNHMGYHLEGKEAFFESIPDLVAHYQKFPAKGRQLLGMACDRGLSETVLGTNDLDQNITFRKESSTLKVKWRKCADMPEPISVPQVVKIGNHVYVGGGMRRMEGPQSKMFKYSLHEDTWTVLPLCRTDCHSLATLDDELLAIGGMMSEYEVAHTVYTLRRNKWMEVLPPMPTPRYFHSSATHEKRVIITAGGTTSIKETGENIRTDAVEIYIKDTQWYTTKRLPFPSSSFSLRIINGTCYILGGSTTNYTMYATISSLLENAEPADSKYSMPQCPVTWNPLKEKHPLILNTAVEINGNLFVMGGSAATTIRHGTRFVSTYDFATDTWVECKGAELPVPLYRTTALNLDNDEVICIGGQPKSQQFSAEVFIGSYIHVQ